MRSIVMPLFDRMRDAEDSQELVWAVAIVLHHVTDYIATDRLDSGSTRKDHIEECSKIRKEHECLALLGRVADSFKHSNKTEKIDGQPQLVAKSIDFNNLWSIPDFYDMNDFWGVSHVVDSKSVAVRQLVYEVYEYWRRKLSI